LFKTLPENPGICCFIWEHFQNVNQILQRVRHAGDTFLAAKSHIYTAHIQKIVDWPICKSLTEVRGFLGTVGTIRIFIKDYATIACPLVHLTRKDIEFTFGKQELEAMKKLKTLAKNSSAIHAINYASRHKVILAVDTSSIAVGYILSQIGVDSKQYPSQFGLMTLSERESSYSQAKLELFGLFCTLKDCQIWIIGVKNLVVEVDAKYIKGMINNSDIQPNTTINCWISAILLFNFQLHYVPGHAYGPDGLSGRP